jgi:hypothetical protein
VSRVATAAVAAAVLLGGCGGVDEAKKDAAITAARVAYEKARAEGTDFSRGPCIADPLPAPSSDWVVDVAHEPRRDVDDRPENQCSSYRKGDADHFVELDPNGDLIRAE